MRNTPLTRCCFSLYCDTRAHNGRRPAPRRPREIGSHSSGHHSSATHSDIRCHAGEVANCPDHRADHAGSARIPGGPTRDECPEMSRRSPPACIARTARRRRNGGETADFLRNGQHGTDRDNWHRFLARHWHCRQSGRGRRALPSTTDTVSHRPDPTGTGHHRNGTAGRRARRRLRTDTGEPPVVPDNPRPAPSWFVGPPVPGIVHSGGFA